MVHIKNPLMLIEKSSLCSGCSRFPTSLSEWSFTICPTAYNDKQNVLSVSLNKNISFLIYLFEKSSLCSGGSRFSILLSDGI